MVYVFKLVRFYFLPVWINLVYIIVFSLISASQQKKLKTQMIGKPKAELFALNLNILNWYETSFK